MHTQCSHFRKKNEEGLCVRNRPLSIVVQAGQAQGSNIMLFINLRAGLSLTRDGPDLCPRTTGRTPVGVLSAWC